MSDGRLSGLWALDEPPARDPEFEVTVMTRILRRRLWADIAAFAPVLIAITIVAWALAPVVGPALQTGSADPVSLLGLVAALGVAAAAIVEACLPDARP